MKKNFLMKKKKNEAGEVTVVKQKTGKRTLIVTGNIKVPFEANFLSNLQSIVNSIGSYFLGLFPTILEQGRDKHISTYSLPEYKNKRYENAVRPESLALWYEFSYLISSTADNISPETIFGSVLSKNQMIGELLTKKINEELTFYSSPDP